MNKTPIKPFWKLMLMVALGIFVGTLAFSTLRVLYYIFQNLHPNMSPFMFIIFSPIISLFITLAASVIELILAKIIHLNIPSYSHSFLLGVSYSSFMLLLISGWLVALVLLFNPVTVHFFIASRHKS